MGDEYEQALDELSGERDRMSAQSELERSGRRDALHHLRRRGRADARAEVDASRELARCVDADGRAETVDTGLVGTVAPGEVLLVHAGTALQREPRPGAPAGGQAMRFVARVPRRRARARAGRGAARRSLEPGRTYKLMEVCGGHTHAIYRYGIEALLPDGVELVHGPGCPVCVLPMGRVDDAHRDRPASRT